MGCMKSKLWNCFKFRKKSFSFEEDSSSSIRSSDVEFQQVSLYRNARPNLNKKRTLHFFSPFSYLHRWRRTPNMSMTKAERTIKAAILIQRWYKRFLARIEIRRRCTWTIFQSIEYASEQDQVRLYNFFNALLTHIPATTRSVGSAANSVCSSTDSLDMRFDDESDEMEEEGMEHVEKGYRGLRLNFPLTREDFDLLLESFRKKKQSRLHAKYVAEILKAAISILKRLPNLNTISTAISKQITICGDLHGKLDDLMVIFHKNGLPSAENPYIFNGDFVDRGKRGLEVFLILLSCLIVFPGGVYLNRGNHEDGVMNSRYGFIREVQSKYRRNSEKLLKLIEGVYRWLPLGTVINNKVLVVHGGISDTTDLDLIKSVDRGKYVSLLRPPIKESLAPSSEVIDKVEWKQVFDILWSDPQSNDGCIPNGLRGAGTYFGPDVTKHFLEKNKMQYIIRSHECKPDGYEISHNGQVITIFSASNYYELGSNKGAYLKLVGSQLDTHFVQYTSSMGKTKRLTFRQRTGLIEASAIKELCGLINTNRAKLEQEFQNHDPENTGYITVSAWCNSMEQATGLGLPWRMLREKFVTLDTDTQKVKYSTTFDKISANNISSVRGSTTVVETLYRNKTNLEAIFRIIDKDNSGYVTLEEFSDACNLIKEHMPNPITQEQLKDICRLMDMNKDGLVDLNEFLETFRMVDPEQKNSMCREEDDASPKPSTSNTLTISPVLSSRKME